MISSIGLACLAAAAFGRTPAGPAPYLHAPAVNQYSRHDPSGTTILPNGRFLRPVGRHTPVGESPHNLILTPDGRTAFVASEGGGRLIEEWAGGSPHVREIRINVEGRKRGKSSAGGAAFSADGRTLYWSSGESGEVRVFDVASAEESDPIGLNVEIGGRRFADSFANDLRLSADGRRLYCADVTNFRVVTIDVASRKVVGSTAVGRYPYALAVCGDRVCVANIGLFEYQPIAPPTLPWSGKKPDPRGLSYPAFGFPSREAEVGVVAEGRKVAGLGKPNVPESFSVWILREGPAGLRVERRVKTGLLIGAPTDNGRAVGGSAPNFVLCRGGSVWVSNGNNDMVERIDLRTGRIAARRRIVPSPLTARLRGVGPSGMAVSPDGRRLYVAESGINALAVLDAGTLAVLGHIPTAWYPYRVAMTPDGGTMATICFKGFGNGPSAAQPRPASPFLGQLGAFSVFPTPKAGALPAMTKTVLRCNGMVDGSANRARLSSPVVPTTPGIASSQIKYVVFITKENHTYDAVFDRVPGANDAPRLLRWGLDQTISAPGQPTLEHAAVMTNHNALAREFVVSDNFHMEPEASGVGHRWLVGVQPNTFCQMTYTLGWDFSANSTAPGRRASFGSNGSIAPEDYPEAGSMWEHLAHFGIPFRNYGEGFEFAGVGEDEDESPTGAREVVNIPMPKALFDNTCREFPIFNMNIPDQYRAWWFEKDFRQRFMNGKPAPRFINIAICNDHGSGPQPKRGYPYLASWMADNDLALGRIVEFLSHTPYWKNMAIFVTQDDSGGEPDHVDAQRSVMLVISPWARRGTVSHRHTTITSMHRTLYEILGLPALNMFDGLASDLSDCFTTKPNFAPYVCRPVDSRIFDPEKAKDPKDPEYKMAARRPSIARDDPDDEADLLRAGGSGSHPSSPRH